MASASADVLQLTVTSIVNPGLQGITIQVTLQGSVNEQHQAVPVGAVTPFPADQPSSYAMPLGPDAARVVGGADGPIDVVLELLPVDPARPLAPPLSIELSASLTVEGS